MAARRSRLVADRISKVDADRACAADALELALLQHSQQLALQRVGKLAHFVEEDRSSVGELEPAFLLRHGASERAALVPEQFAFEQRLREGGAIDRDKRLSRARAVEMNRACRQFLAGTGFAGDEDSRIDARDFGDAGVDGGDCRTAPDHLAGQMQVSLQAVCLTFERPEPPQVVDRDRRNSRHRCRELQMIVREGRPGAGCQIDQAEQVPLHRQRYGHNRRHTRVVWANLLRGGRPARRRREQDADALTHDSADDGGIDVHKARTCDWTNCLDVELGVCTGTKNHTFGHGQGLEEQVEELDVELALVADGMDCGADGEQRLQSFRAGIQRGRRSARTEIDDVLECQTSRRRQRCVLVERDPTREGARVVRKQKQVAPCGDAVTVYEHVELNLTAVHERAVGTADVSYCPAVRLETEDTVQSRQCCIRYADAIARVATERDCGGFERIHVAGQFAADHDKLRRDALLHSSSPAPQKNPRESVTRALSLGLMECVGQAAQPRKVREEVQLSWTPSSSILCYSLLLSVRVIMIPRSRGSGPPRWSTLTNNTLPLWSK